MLTDITGRRDKQEINNGDNVHGDSLHNSSLDSKTRRSWKGIYSSNCKAMRAAFIYTPAC